MIRGLTTAAGLWVTAAIGLACGTGMYAAAAVGTVLVLVGLEVLNALLPQLGTATVQLTFQATSRESVKKVMDEIKHENLEIRTYELKDRRTSQGEIYEVSVELKVKRGHHNERILSYLDDFDDVTISSIE